jgi:DNA-binding transcriptional LysR family regulator
MEIFELKYFVHAAREQSIQKAAEKIPISPASVSKAISRLEEELGNVNLFQRTGRNLSLTPAGHHLLQKAEEILNLESQAKILIGAQQEHHYLKVCGTDLQLALWGPRLIKKILKRRPKTLFEFVHCANDLESFRLLSNFECDFALGGAAVSGKVLSEKLGTEEFGTFVGLSHPLMSKGENQVWTIKDVLKHPFVLPSKPFYNGSLGSWKGATDGWRDDLFPRKHSVLVPTFAVLSTMVKNGLGLGYLPKSLGKELGLNLVTISGCDEVCELAGYIFAKDSSKGKTYFDFIN